MENDKRVEILSKIEALIANWKNGDKTASTTLDDVYDAMEEYNKWEEAEMRRLMNEEMKRNSITIQSKITYGGRLETSPIEWD